MLCSVPSSFNFGRNHVLLFVTTLNTRSSALEWGSVNTSQATFESLINLGVSSGILIILKYAQIVSILYIFCLSILSGNLEILFQLI